MRTPARASTRAQLTATDLRVRRGGRTVLDQVTLTVAPGSRWGVVGENGRGKTTLLHALTGRLAPDAGVVRCVGTTGLAEQEVPATGTVGDLLTVELARPRAALTAVDAAAAALADGAPGAEDDYAAALEAAEAIDAWDAERRVDTALAGLGAVADRERPLAALSVGQRYRVRLACLLGAGHDFLLLDEPTNHLDAAGLAHLTARLRAHPGGVVLVSHDRALLSDVVTDVLDLDPSRDGAPRAHGGGFAGYRAGRAAELERWTAEYDRQVAERAQLTDDLSAAQNRLVAGWRPDKGTGRHQRATRAPALVRSVHRRRDDLDRHAITEPVPPPRFRMPELPTRPGATLLAADGVRVAGRLDRPVSLAVGSGDRLVVTGRNGAGKSTLLSVLSGHLRPTAGTVRRTPGIGFLGQESAPSGGHRVREVLGDGGHFGLLSAADPGRPVAELSTGQRRRLELAVVLGAHPSVLLLDEPTNHLSMPLVDELTAALLTTGAAVVVATHDRQLLRDLAAWPRIELDG